jgi:GNAT superfamily N-acetyltransferase
LRILYKAVFSIIQSISFQISFLLSDYLYAMTEIIQATPAHAQTICEIAKKTWWPAYSAILEAEQIRYMLDKIYAEENIRSQVETRNQQYLLLLEEGTPKGFAAYAPKEEKPGIFKLHKLYCLPETQGKGYGRLLIDAVAEKVREAGGRTLELNVNRYNRAKSFYERMGFTIAYEEDIPIGPYWMNDFVMRKEL